MKRTAIIQIQLRSRVLAETILKALAPEAKRPATSRSRVTLRRRDRRLIIKVEANDTSALRSTLNSYLRWVALAKDTYDATVNLEKPSTAKTLN